MEFLNSQDIKMNLLHEREMAIARSNKGVGNLRLSVDERGVNFEFEAPRCDLGDRALELIRAGVYTGCSFEFYPQDYDVTERGEDVIITHTKFRAITALTIGMDPAYKQTSVNARELYEQYHQETEEEKAEREAAEAAERERIEQQKREELEQMLATQRRRSLRRSLERNIESLIF
jgi:HK97 family phage prohead protease